MLTDEEVIDLWNEHMVWGDPKRGGFDDFLSAVRAAVAAERKRCAALADSMRIGMPGHTAPHPVFLYRGDVGEMIRGA